MARTRPREQTDKMASARRNPRCTARRRAARRGQGVAACVRVEVRVIAHGELAARRGLTVASREPRVRPLRRGLSHVTPRPQGRGGTQCWVWASRGAALGEAGGTWPSHSLPPVARLTARLLCAGSRPWAVAFTVMQDGDSFYDEGSPAPPLLHHQFGEFGYASRTSSPPLFRSMYAGQEYGEYSGQEMVSEAYSDSGAYDEPPVYRSISRLFHEDTQTMVQGGGGGYGMGAVGACWGDPDAPVYKGDLGYLNPAEVVMAPAEFNFELPREIFDIVLSFLPSHPGEHLTMRCQANASAPLSPSADAPA